MKSQKGFTLIELLVVVAILAVLAAIAIPNVSKFIGRGTVEAANTELHMVGTAVVSYQVDNNGAIPNENDTDEWNGLLTYITGTLKGTYIVNDDTGEVSGNTYPNLKWDETTKLWVKQ